MTESRRSLRFSLYVAALVAILGVALVAIIGDAAARGALPGDVLGKYLWILLVLATAAVVAELQDVVLSRGQISVSYPIHVAAVVFFGPLWTAVIAALSSLPLWLERSKPVSIRLFNTAQFILSALAASLCFVWLGGVPLRMAQGTPPPVPLAAAATVAALVNLSLGSLGLWFYRGDDLRRTFAMLASMLLPSQLALGLVGVAMAFVLKSMGVFGFALFVVPLLVARQTYQRSVQLREAYADTIASLVGALEAKDVYTKGHSVRVAKYAMAIAPRVGMSQGAADRLEWAALLHDIGKVGIKRRLLAKTARLSEEEYGIIKEHPAIGAKILADVPYLADLVPAIEAHHEKLDGSGYGHGAKGDEIPLAARILAVADAYDAMTSTRPYREAMPHEAAFAELVRCSGTQFDSEVVEAFAAAISDDPGLLLEEPG